MDPRSFTIRESRDSPEHLRSRAITFVLDVTRSMGDIPHALATRTLPDLGIRVERIFPDAQFQIMGIGDAEEADRAPLQVGQWETVGNLVDEALTRLFLEEGGGRIGEESYDLGMYVLARCSHTDCWEERREPGYAFFTGDEKPRHRVSAAVVNRVFGKQMLDADIPIQQVVAEASEKFRVFFLVPDLRRAEECAAAWNTLLGEHVIHMEHPDDTAIIAAELIMLTEGMAPNLDDTFERLIKDGIEREVVKRVYRALRPYAMTLGALPRLRDVSECRMLPSTRPSGLRSLRA
jgi:hypothetical protein